MEHSPPNTPNTKGLFIAVLLFAKSCPTTKIKIHTKRQETVRKDTAKSQADIAGMMEFKTTMNNMPKDSNGYSRVFLN
jgi:hypothetical protein